jgi:hypothetical protein
LCVKKCLNPNLPLRVAFAHRSAARTGRFVF